MKRIHKLIACFLSVILTCVVIAYFSAERVQSQDISVPEPRLSSQIPPNPNLSTGVNYNNEIMFGEFAWRTFIALNWPADCPSGSLLKEDQIIGQAPDKPRVWEFYNFPGNIFLKDGQDPTIKKDGQYFTIKKAVPYQCRASTESKPDLDEISIYLPGDKPGVRDKVLVDRAGNYVLNEIRMNPVEVNQIVDNKWYSAHKPNEYKDFSKNFPVQLKCSSKDKDKDGRDRGSSSTVPCSEYADNEGAIELKASWKVLNLTNREYPIDKPCQYYTTKRTFKVQGKKNPVAIDVGLVGFHMAIKTSQQGWVWATFEHIKNAPDDNPKSPPTGSYNLYDCTVNCEKIDENTLNKPRATSPYLWGDKFPYAVTDTGEKQNSSQITRLVPITQASHSLNDAWHGAMDKSSIWQNYQLIGTQWLKNPDQPYDIDDRIVQPNQGSDPSMLANVTIEPYVQTNTDGKSCVTCHTNAIMLNSAVKSDFSFLLRRAQPKSP